MPVKTFGSGGYYMSYFLKENCDATKGKCSLWIQLGIMLKTIKNS